jgi:phthiodiolone/phenolphthiodiolone dimycocerosates ketoreductase
MSPRALQVDVPIVHSRYLPASAAIDTARELHASGAIDSVTVWDQMTFFAPSRLWTPERTPLAAVMPDIDSFPDPYIILSQIAAHVPDVGLTTTSDAVRRAPSEMTQTMLTLAGLTSGTAMVQMGAGEAKQCRPFGHKRSQGIKRLDDHFQIFRKYMESTDPIDHDGHHWKLKDAWIGGERLNRPELWALGGGPRLIATAARYGDGFAAAAPYVWSRPEQAVDCIAAMKEAIAANGRDPEEFGFGIWWICLLHEDRAVIDASMRNDYVRWLAVTLGRFHSPAWREAGIEPPMGDEFHYANDLLPTSIGEQETYDILSRATREVVKNGWFHGSPAEMADQIKPFIDAGVNWVQIDDMLPLTRPAEEAPEGLARTIELARLLKDYSSRNASSR